MKTDAQRRAQRRDDARDAMLMEMNVAICLLLECQIHPHRAPTIMTSEINRSQGALQAHRDILARAIEETTI